MTLSYLILLPLQIKTTIVMKSLLTLLFTGIIFLHSAYTCKAQKITLIQKKTTFYNMTTGAVTSSVKYTFLVDGDPNPKRSGYFGQNLKNYVKSDPTALKFMNLYATYQKLKLGSSISTVGLFSAFAITNLSKSSVAVENINKPLRGKGFLYAAIGTLGTNIVFNLLQPNTIMDAVDSYNRNYKGSARIRFHDLNFTNQTIASNPNSRFYLRFNFKLYLKVNESGPYLTWAVSGQLSFQLRSIQSGQCTRLHSFTCIV